MMMTDEFAAQTHDMRYELVSLTLIVGLQWYFHFKSSLVCEVSGKHIHTQVHMCASE